jgi:hypothetical protein
MDVTGPLLRIHIFFDADPDLAPTFLVNADPDPDPDQGFWWPKMEKKITMTVLKKIFGSKISIYLTIKDVQATVKAFSSQKRTSSTAKHEIYLFFYFWGLFALLYVDPDPANQNQCGSWSATLTRTVNSEKLLRNLLYTWTAVETAGSPLYLFIFQIHCPSKGGSE